MIDKMLEENSNIKNEKAGYNTFGLKRLQDISDIKIPFKLKYMEQSRGIYIYEYTEQNIIKHSKIDSSIFRENKLYLIVDIICKKFHKISKKTYFIAPYCTANKLLFDRLIMIVKKMIDLDSIRMEINSLMFIVAENDQPDRFVEILWELDKKSTEPEELHKAKKWFGQTVKPRRENIFKNKKQNQKSDKDDICLTYAGNTIIHRDIKLRQSIEINDNIVEDNSNKNHDIMTDKIKFLNIRKFFEKKSKLNINNEKCEKDTVEGHKIKPLKLKSNKNKSEDLSSFFGSENNIQTKPNDCKDNKNKLQAGETNNDIELTESTAYNDESSPNKPIESDYRIKKNVSTPISVENIMNFRRRIKNVPIEKNDYEKIEQIQNIQDEDEMLNEKIYRESLIKSEIIEEKSNKSPLFEKMKKSSIFQRFTIFNNPNNKNNSIEIKNNGKGKKLDFKTESRVCQNTNQTDSNKNY